MSSLRKVGVFLTLLGGFLLALFVFSDIAKQPEFGLLLAGMATTVLGIFLMVTNPNPQVTPNPRFRMVRGHKNEPQPKGPPGGDKPAEGGFSKSESGPARSGGAPAKGAPPPGGGKQRKK